MASRHWRGRVKIGKTNIVKYVLFCSQISYPNRELIVSPSPSNPPLSEAQKIEQLEKELQWAKLKILVLEERLRMEMIRKYGPKSETLSDAQLQLLELEPGVSVEEVQAESEREPLPSTPSETATAENPKRRKHPGRQQLPAHLSRVEKVIPCTPEQCVCKACGKDTVVIGYEQSEQLDVQPAEYFVLVIRREKRACRACAEGGVKAAPVPAKIIEKGLVSDRVVIDTLVGKYSDHLPLYRQSAILKRETGLSISRATMDGWVMQVGGLLNPMAAAIGRELLGGSYIQADETPVPVQMHDGRGKHHQAYLWQYGHPGGSVVFDFQLGRGREGPKNFLGQFQGILQTDGYTVYDRVGGSGMVHAACWAHSRRKLFDAVKLNPDDLLATRLVARIDELFAIDAEARAAGINQVARHTLRQERSRPLLDVIKRELEAAHSAVLPASALGKAIGYTLSLWHKLTRFLEYPELELSNNLAENSMRPVVVGRKNWIHVGSEQAGPKVAAILSVIESCRRLKLPVRDYLTAILPSLANLPVQRVGQYTPAAWAASRV
jgi:transposase